MDNRHTGSCLCGRVKFELRGDFVSFFLCYCTRCQKGTGSAHAANLFVEGALLTWLQGEQAIKLYQHADSLHTKCFCQHCGSALPLFEESTNCIKVPAGSLDSTIPILPTAKIFCADRAGWSKNVSNVPSFDELSITSTKIKGD